MSTLASVEDDTRWLEPAELAAWLPLLRLVQRLPHALDAQLREDVGISHAYYSMLAVLSEAQERTLSMGELARATGTTPSRLSHAIDVLQQRGWVERIRCEADRRIQYARLTDAGFEMLVDVAPRHVAQVRELVFDRLDARQVAVLTEVCASVLEAIEDCS